jgi:hypothetical protein
LGGDFQADDALVPDDIALVDAHGAGSRHAAGGATVIHGNEDEIEDVTTDAEQSDRDWLDTTKLQLYIMNQLFLMLRLADIFQYKFNL